MSPARHSLSTRNSQGNRKRSAVISFLGVCSLLLLALTIFAVASQARTLSSDVEEAVQTGENLRVVSIARAELSVASRVAGTSPDQVVVIDGAIENAQQALDAVEENLDLVSSPEVVEAFADFRRAADSQIIQLTEAATDLDAAQDAEVATGEAFTALAEVLRSNQISSIDGLEAGNDLMNLIATIATFVVAFVVPSMGLLIFQALRSAPREQRKLAFEHNRLEKQSQAMAAAVAQEAAALRSHLSINTSKVDRRVVSRSLLRFESVAAANGSPTSIRSENLVINDLVEAAVKQLHAESVVSIDRSGEWLAIGDRERVSLVIAELLSNALTHGVAPVRTMLKAEESVLELHVIDHGSGLSEELVDALIEENEFKLRQLSSVGKYGFGLTAARRSLEAMGGNLQYERDGNQTHIIATLPIAEADEQTSTSSRGSDGTGIGELPNAA